MPFLGILEDRKLQTVPGTVILEEDAANLQSVTGALRHGTGHSANIVLVPQPSNDPNDPLNWTYTKKLRALSVTISGSILYSAVMTSMLNPAFGTIAKDLHVPVAKVVVLS
ncbi:hypothetical protein MMC08_008997, partial [Hypocenomyce scalaris]|nr:hypothetical protein [Hypocenomyce scalaris]